ncbi:DUF1127 domain-containing protein [Sedimenticola sp.]|uniref:DUF1127 domain-containing protein n=1 Tax=Sedimenticola sp. TaxID=1940285 RepID=UPI003D134CCC
MTTQTKQLNLQASNFRLIGFNARVLPVFQWLYAAYERQRQRQALLKLDDRLLSDIGVSRADADNEGSKPFWKE